MPKTQPAIPSYRLHKQSGQAICTLNGRDFLLGPWKSAASRKKYDRLIREWLDNDRQPFVSEEDGLAVVELADHYWRFAHRYYVKAGLPTDEQNCIKSALRPLLRLYEDELATKFGPKMLRAVRGEMIEADWTRQTINKNVDRIRRMFCWAVEEELVPETVYRALKALKPLTKGRTVAREAPPIKPVEAMVVEATLQHLPQTVAAMARLQQLTGMRPAEVCCIKPCDIDRSVNPWRYVPESHKCEHRDKERVIFLGPQAQEILLPYLLRDPATYCFRPIDSESRRRAEQHATRKTPIGHGNRPGSNRKRKPKRAPGGCYDVDSYRRAIDRACTRAFPPPAQVARAKGESNKQWRARLTPAAKKILAQHYAKFRWSPNRLRHSAATAIRKQFGSEAARTVLGHTNLSTTEIYAEKSIIGLGANLLTIDASDNPTITRPAC